MSEPYDLLVSLGHWCGPAANIRRRFGVAAAMPFDWWVTPYRGATQLLNERFANLFRPENLEVIDADEPQNTTVRCSHYGILHHHDFARGADGRIIPDLLSQIPDLRAKYTMLKERFYGAFYGKRCLVIRTDLQSELTENGALEYIAPKQQIERASGLYDLLVSSLSPGELDLLVLSNIGSQSIATSSGSILFDTLGDLLLSNKIFMDDNYDVLFDRLDIALRAPPGDVRLATAKAQIRQA